MSRYYHTSGDYRRPIATARRFKIACQRGKHCTAPYGSQVIPIEGRWLCIFCAMDYLNVLYHREAFYVMGWQVT